jgi:Protein of unknown function (DUF1391)
MKTLDLGNNDSLNVGIARVADGWIAWTLTQSKTFKTEIGATKWLKRKGYNADGSRV